MVAIQGEIPKPEPTCMCKIHREYDREGFAKCYCKDKNCECYKKREGDDEK